MKKTLCLGLFVLLFAHGELSAEPQVLDEDSDPKSITQAQKKSGFLVGVEALFGSAITQSQVQSQEKNTSVFSLMGGFYGGYQHYFDDHFGIKVLLSVHDGTPIMAEFQVQNVIMQTFALPFWIGTELSMLWDFWQEGEHAIGLNAGLGYNFELYHTREVKIGSNTHFLPKTYQHNLYPILGIHYYYGHHQMGLNYRFIGSFGSKASTHDVAGFPLKLQYVFEDYFNFSYTYRF